MNSQLDVSKVLIVDDEPDFREILMSVMEEQHVQTEQAEDGRMALEKLRKGEFHAVLCDIMMPNMSGLECLAQSQLEGMVTPFIFLTGSGESDRMLQAIRLGAIDFITKPFNNQEVIDIVFRVLDIGRRRSRLRREIGELGSDLTDKVIKDEKMISLMRVNNNRKRMGG